MATGELVDDDIITEELGGGLAQFNREEIDMQVATAHRFPRSIKQFRQEVGEMACLDEETAGTMFYALPRGGKKIEGPSARFAEVVGAAYGNLRYGARIVGIEGNFVVAEGVCFDVQKNVSATVHVRRRITNKEGRKFDDDMIQVTGNAACSIALRNAIFKVVPMGLVKDIYEQAKLTSIGKAKSISEQRHKMLDWFAKTGATQEVVLASLGRAGLDDVTQDDLILLRGMVNAIKEGDVTIESAFDQVATRRGVKRTSIEDEIPEAPKGKAKPANGKAASKTAPKPQTEEPEAAADNGECSESFHRFMVDMERATTSPELVAISLEVDNADDLLDGERESLLADLSDRTKAAKKAEAVA